MCINPVYSKNEKQRDESLRKCIIPVGHLLWIILQLLQTDLLSPRGGAVTPCCVCVKQSHRVHTDPMMWLSSPQVEKVEPAPVYTLCHRRSKGSYSVSLCKPHTSMTKFKHHGLARRQVTAIVVEHAASHAAGRWNKYSFLSGSWRINSPDLPRL